MPKIAAKQLALVAATTSVDGLLSTADKTRLDGMETGAQATSSARVQAALAAVIGAVSVNNQRISNVADPSSAQDAATKAYCDALAQGLDVKTSCRLVATTNIASLSGVQLIDGVATTAERVLIAGQTTASQNGIYLTNTAGAWARATDADTSAEVTGGMFTFITEGTTYADSGWVLTTNDPITLGTTSLAFSQFSGAGQITAGGGLTKTGNQLDVVAHADGSIVVAADTVQVGVLATDAQHGSRGGAALHANATTTTAGFQSAADKARADAGTTLDVAATFATPTIGQWSMVTGNVTLPTTTVLGSTVGLYALSSIRVTPPSGHTIVKNGQSTTGTVAMLAGTYTEWTLANFAGNLTWFPRPQGDPTHPVDQSQSKFLRSVYPADYNNTFLPVRKTVYWVYIGRANYDLTIQEIDAWCITAGTGTTGAQFVAGSTPSGPARGSAQNVTCIGLFATVSNLTSNNICMFAAGTISVAAGTHMWLGARFDFATTQPRFANLFGWNYSGALLETTTLAAAPVASTAYATVTPAGGQLLSLDISCSIA